MPASKKKRDAARKNGRLGGRPSKMAALLERMRSMRAGLADRVLDVDPHDLDLIIERLCRLPGDGRRFFIYASNGGGYAF
jgi:hypothetical protein